MRSVDSKVYTKEYYLKDCSNFTEFNQSGGEVLGARFKALLPYLNIQPGMRVLDIGSGRGELCFYAAKKGAEVIGVDYAKSAIDLANKTLEKKNKEIRSRIKFIQSSVNQMDFPPHYFDLVISVEVLEHLYPEEVEVMLKKVRQYVKPKGNFVFHTAPNRWFNDYTYRYYCYPIGSSLIRFSNLLTKSKYPALENPRQIRTESHKVMHVNEPTYYSLKKDFQKSGLNFKIRSTNVTVNKPILSWKDKLYNLLVYGSPLSNHFPLNIFWGNDFLITST